MAAAGAGHGAASAVKDDAAVKSLGRAVLVRTSFAKVMQTPVYEQKNNRLSPKWIKRAYGFVLALSGCAANADGLADEVKHPIAAVLLAYAQDDVKALEKATRMLEHLQSLVYLSAAEQPSFPCVTKIDPCGDDDIAKAANRLIDDEPTPDEADRIALFTHEEVIRRFDIAFSRAGADTPALAHVPARLKPASARMRHALTLLEIIPNTIAFMRRKLFQLENAQMTVVAGKDPLLGFCVDPISNETNARFHILHHLALMAMPPFGYRYKTPLDISTFWVLKCMMTIAHKSAYWTADAGAERFVMTQYLNCPTALGELITVSYNHEEYRLDYFPLTNRHYTATSDVWCVELVTACTLALRYREQSEVERQVLRDMVAEFYARAKKAQPDEAVDAYFREPRIRASSPEPVVTVLNARGLTFGAVSKDQDRSIAEETHAHRVALLAATLYCIALLPGERSASSFSTVYLQYRNGVIATALPPRRPVAAAAAAANAYSKPASL